MSSVFALAEQVVERLRVAAGHHLVYLLHHAVLAEGTQGEPYMVLVVFDQQDVLGVHAAFT